VTCGAMGDTGAAGSFNHDDTVLSVGTGTSGFAAATGLRAAMAGGDCGPVTASVACDSVQEGEGGATCRSDLGGPTTVLL